MKEQLKKIILEVIEVCKETGLKCDDNNILDNCFKYLISHEIQENKTPKSKDEPATQKQKAFLLRNEVNFPDNMTKLEASAMIKEIMEHKEEI